MVSSAKCWILSFLIFINLQTQATAATAADLRTLRYLSQAIRDKPPTPAEAQAFYKGETTLEQLRDSWLANTEQKDRVARFFSDLLGAPRDFFATDSVYFLEQNSEGIWYSAEKGNCTAAAAVTAKAWWLATDETLTICSNISSSQVAITINGHYYGCYWQEGFLQNGCGCGPEQVLCYPKSMRTRLETDLAQEFKDRATYVYTERLDWSDLLASSQIFGNRALANFYLLNQYVVPWSTPPSAAEIARLHTIPLSDKAWVAGASSGAERSGIATSPAFMRRYNNGRSRIRALTDALLCHDIDSSLNTSGIDHLVNPDVDALGQSIVARPQCAVCHYGMDNLASTLFGWNDNGIFVRWPAQLSQTGHAFGQDITGPSALMEGYVQRGPGFLECMGRRVWEDISGRLWTDLSSDEQSTFLAAAGESPYALFTSVFQSKALLQARNASPP